MTLTEKILATFELLGSAALSLLPFLLTHLRARRSRRKVEHEAEEPP